MNKKLIGKALLFVGAAAAVTALAKGFLPSIVKTAAVGNFSAKLPAIPTQNNGANAAIGVGLALVGFYLKK